MSDLALIETRPAQPCRHVWDDPYIDLPGHATHRCVFTASRSDHTRHECRCGLNTHTAALHARLSPEQTTRAAAPTPTAPTAPHAPTRHNRKDHS